MEFLLVWDWPGWGLTCPGRPITSAWSLGEAG
jgi:hypothetical protein